MIKGQLVRWVADRARVEPSQVAAMFEALEALAIERLTVGSRISIDGLGTLELVELPAPSAGAPPDEANRASAETAGDRRTKTSPTSTRPDSEAVKEGRAPTRRAPKEPPRRDLPSTRARTSAARTVAPGGEAGVGCLHDVVEGLIAAARGDKRTTKRGW